MGLGRTVALAIGLGAILPIVVLHRYADVRIARWAMVAPGSGDHAFWRTLAPLGQPLTWFVAAVVGFGVAAAFNWSNTARWTGMLALAVLWAGLANVAVGGQPTGAATAGAVAATLGLWAPRGWLAWLALAVLVVVAQIVTRGLSGTQGAVGLLLGALGVLLIEYAWHHAAPETPPLRGRGWRV
jgi:hypothetical protein